MGRGRSSSGSSRGSSSSGNRGSSSWSSRGRSSWNSSRSTSTIHRSGNRTTIIYSDSSYGSGGSGGSVIAWIVGIMFIMVGIGVLLGGIGSFFSSFKYDDVSATCLENDYHGGWYYTTYRYYVNGKEYVSESNQGWEEPERLNAVVTIYYEKDNPYEISEENPADASGAGIMVVSGLVTIGLGSLPIVFAIKDKKKQKQPENNENIEEEPVVENPVDEHNVCRYCGAKYDRCSTSCPKCGAGKE